MTELEPLEAAEAYVGRNMLEACVDELKIIQDPWSKLSQAKQDEAIRRLERRIQSSVRTAFKMMLTGEYPATRAELAGVKFTSKGIAATLHIDRNSTARHELADYAGLGADVVVIMADPEEYFAMMEDVIGDAEQLGLALKVGDAPPGVDLETGEVTSDGDDMALGVNELIDILSDIDVRFNQEYLEDLDADGRKALWAWLIVQDIADGDADDEDIKKRAEAGAVIFEELQVAARGQLDPDPDPAGTEPVEAATDADVAAELAEHGIVVTAEFVNAMDSYKLQQVQKYLEEFETGTGPAEVPEFLTPYMEPMLQNQNLGGEPEPEDGEGVSDEVQRLLNLMAANNVKIPEHAVHALTAEERKIAFAYAAGQLGAMVPDFLAKFMEPEKKGPAKKKRNTKKKSST